MDYTLLYSVGIDGFFQMISGPAGGVMVIAFGILTLRLRQKRPAPVLPRSPGKPLGILLLIVLGIAILGPAAIEAFSYVHLLLAQNTGRYKTIEGPITKYVPATPRNAHDGGRDEIFTVAGVTFDMNAQFVGFSRTQDKGSPLRAGDNVRIAYVFKGDNQPVIIRLEKAN